MDIQESVKQTNNLLAESIPTDLFSSEEEAGRYKQTLHELNEKNRQSQIATSRSSIKDLPLF